VLALSRLRPLPSAVGRPDRRGPCADAAAGAVETLLVRAVGIHRPDLGHVASRLARCVEEHELPAVGRPVGNTGAAASRLGVDQLNVGPVRVGDFDAMGAVEGEFAPVGRSLRIRSVSDRGQMRPVRTDGVDPGRSARDAFEDQKTAVRGPARVDVVTPRPAVGEAVRPPTFGTDDPDRLAAARPVPAERDPATAR
jgi:hypothetical protein